MTKNNWTILKVLSIPLKQNRYFLCKCKCGKEKLIPAYAINNNRTTQCRECAFTTHKMSRSKTYKIWGGMLSRCRDKNVKIYKYYGGRGISVSKEWLKFENFYRDMGERPSGKQLDRINNDGPYEFLNCRWVFPKENNPYNKGTIPDKMPGKFFGKWYVIKRVIHKPGHWYYECRCNCGTEKIICGGELRRKRTTQCRKCKNKEHSIIHKGWNKKIKKAEKEV